MNERDETDRPTDKNEKWSHSVEPRPEVFQWRLGCYLRGPFTRRQHHGIGLIQCVPVQARRDTSGVLNVYTGIFRSLLKNKKPVRFCNLTGLL